MQRNISTSLYVQVLWLGGPPGNFPVSRWASPPTKKHYKCCSRIFLVNHVVDLWNCLPVDIVDFTFLTAFQRTFNLVDVTDYYAALLRRRCRILRRTLSVRLSVRPFPLLLTLEHRPRVFVNMADVRYRLFRSHARAAYSTAISAAQACLHCI